MDLCSYLTDQNTRVKKKKSALVSSNRKTGRGIDDDLPELEGDEEKLLSVIGGRIVVDGDKQIEQFGIPSQHLQVSSASSQSSTECITLGATSDNPYSFFCIV